MKRFVYASSLIVVVLAATAFSFSPGKKVQQASTQPTSITQVAKWTVDKAHSNVKFAVTHMVVSEVEGSFKNFEGSLESAKPDFSDAKVVFTVDVNSINTENENRDKHLKSDDFFSAEKFPSMKFESTSMTPAGDKKYKLTGNLTIRDVTKPVTFDVTFGGSTTARNTLVAGFKAKTTINRFDYNLKWDRATETGGLVVSKEVDVTINVELKKG